MSFCALLQCAVAIVILSSGCKNEPLTFTNPLNPASDNYIPFLTSDKGIMIDDFDDGADPNLLGFCRMVFKDSLTLIELNTSYHSEPQNVLRRVGFSIRIDFDVSMEGAFGGYVQSLTGNDRCPSPRGLFNLENLNLDALTFWVKTESLGINFEIALKSIDDVQTNPKRLIRDYVTPDNLWKKVRIPIPDLVLDQSGGTVDLQNLREINFGFARERFREEGAALSGTIYIDEIAFER